MKDYRTVVADEALENDLRALVRLSIAEDLRNAVDWTTVCLIPPDRRGCCQIVPRVTGICAGLAVLPWIVDEFDADLEVECHCQDKASLTPGNAIATMRGNVRDLLTCERTVLNVINRLCGIATLTGRYVEAIGESSSRLYDTRKTTPGWRLLEKYAVACGGGHNHRSGLYDGFLIKDNHLALAGDRDEASGTSEKMSASAAAQKAIDWRGATVEHLQAPEIVEIEVDSLDQFRDVIQVRPDIVLLDNFTVSELREAVAIRDQADVPIELEASGNVRLETIAEIATTGVDRISCGALTHQATSLDLGLDWIGETLS
ncbi:Nicotinate-nucleotide pyrophosphorylase [carboxylating] [Planctomycetes bacterium CA13]|uniref:Probable nicotinate-nucleotide pyrophosphorylase [carboxylating] n=1 Tax=Novipirellula herctigrandis TaxID=2527986 RepID=A0A5C5YP09_9BACT|nr:Nicotinate-nucleotide pyrophosphorylase [carboxylating] [Planctomycetes bacterium CA13]